MEKQTEFDKLPKEEQDRISDLILGYFGLKRVKVQPPKSDDVVFGYFQSSCDVIDEDNAWGFDVYKDGRLVHKHDRSEKKPFDEEQYQLPDEAVKRLQALLRPEIPKFQNFVMHTSYRGLDGWTDNFEYLGYDMAAWCIYHRAKEKLDSYKAGSTDYIDYQQDLTVLELFCKGCAILRDYGFDITLDGLRKMDGEGITDAPDQTVAEVSDTLMERNMEAYKELAK